MGYDKGGYRRRSDEGRYDRGDGRDRLERAQKEAPTRSEPKRERAATVERPVERPRKEAPKRPAPERTTSKRPQPKPQPETTGDQALKAKHGKLIAQSQTHVVRFHQKERTVSIGARWNARHRMVMVIGSIIGAVFVLSNVNFGLGTLMFFAAVFFGIRLLILIGHNVKADKYKHTFDLTRETYLINGATRFVFAQIERFEVEPVNKNTFVVNLLAGSYKVPMYRTAKQNEALTVARYLAQLTHSEQG